MSQVDISLFTPEPVFFDIDGGDSDSLFEALEPRLLEAGYIKPSWLEAIKTREHNYPTGLECEAIKVAIPHVEPENIQKAYIAVIKPSKPIAFGAMGGMVDYPIQTQLVLNLGLLAHAEDQVAVLQALMNVFMNDEACAEILAQDTPETILEVLKRRIAEIDV